MVKKFECRECKKRFDADDSNKVLCPYCKSDNVEYASFHFPKNGYAIIAAIVISASLILLWLKFSNKNEIEQIEIANDEGGPTVVISSNEKPIIKREKCTYNEKDYTYDCSFKVYPQPEQDYKFTIYESGTLVDESNNGVFKGLPCSDNDGIYVVRLMDINADTCICELECPGFDKQVHIEKAWTAEELEQRMNAKENLVDNPYLAPDIKIEITNKDPRNTESLDKISKIVSSVIKRDGVSIKVQSVDYNKQKQISKAVIELGYPADWYDEEEEDW